MEFICKKCGSSRIEMSFSFSGGKYSVKNVPIACCDRYMNPVFPKGKFSVGIQRFASLPSSEKKKILKKRSSKHFDKRIKEAKRGMDLNHLKK